LQANDLAELLSNELNIKINNDPSTGSSLELFGISGENIKILIDGVPVIGRLDGNIDLSQINLDNVEHIEIVEGPMSVSYGSNALGGVINIITKENKYAKFASNIKTYYENVGQYNVSGDISFKGKNSGYTVSGSRQFFSGFSLNDSSRSQTWKPKLQYNLGLKYNYSKNNFKIQNNLSYFNETLWNKGNLLGPYFIKAYDNWFYTNRLSENLQITKKINDNSALNLTLAYSYYDRKKVRYLKNLTNLENILTPNESDHDTVIFHAFMMRGIYNNFQKDKKVNYQIGVDLNHEFALGKRIKNSSDDIGDYAAFASMQWKAFKDFMFQPAFRVSYNTKYSSPITPSINLKYKLKKYIFRLSYARGFRAPSLKELNLYFYDSNHQIEGNENLKAERSHNFNAVVSHKNELFKKPIEIEFKMFYNKIENMISLVQVSQNNALHYRNENIGQFQNHGLQLDFSLKLNNKIRLSSGASIVGNNDAQFENENYVYNTNFNSALNVKLLKNTMNLSVFYKLIGSYPQYYFDENSNIDIFYSDPYHNLDITLDKVFFNRSLKIAIGAKNIFDNTVINMANTAGSHSGSATSLVGWGRTFFASVSYKFYKY
jgi:outer membrane receptor for ferrienterochelin and colicins